MNLSELIVPVPDGIESLQASQRYLVLDIHRLKNDRLLDAKTLTELFAEKQPG